MRNKSLYLSVIICLSLPNITSADVLFDCISYAEGYYGNTKAFQSCKNACESNDGTGCAYLGELFYRNNSYEEAEKYFKKSCDLYSKSGCYRLGYLFENPNGKVHDFVNARKYYEKACNLNHPKGCDDYRRLLQLNDNSNNNIYRSSIQDNDEANCTILIQAKKYTEALPLCIKACDSNIAQICTVIGYLYNTGYGVDQSYKNAGKYYKKGCDLNNKDGCYLLGYLYENPTGTGHDYVNAQKYYEKACNLGSQDGCNSNQLLTQQDSNSNVSINKNSLSGNDAASCGRLILNKKPAEALPLCINACDLNISESCTVLGYLYSTGYGVDQSYKNAGKYYKKSCDLNDEGGCHLLGELYENPTGTGHDYVNARIYYNKSCDLKHGPACVSLGNLYNKGHGVAQSFAKAGMYYKKACNLNEASGCLELGYLYQNPYGREHDYYNANRYYEKACNLGNNQGCVAYQTNTNDPVVKDNQQNKQLSPGNHDYYISDCNRHFKNANYIDAVKSCEKSCNQDNGEGCTKLGVLYYNGQGVHTSKQQSAYYLQKGCNLGYQNGCDYLKGIKNIPLGSSTSPQSHQQKQFNITAFLIVIGPIILLILVGVIAGIKGAIIDAKDRNRRKEEAKRKNSSNNTENTRSGSSPNNTENKKQTDGSQTHSEDSNSSDTGNPLFAELFALAGFVARAQGIISRKQIQEVTKAFAKLGISAQERSYYQKKFNFGKNLHFSPSASCQRLASMVQTMNQDEKKAFIFFSLDLLLPIAFADSIISDEERKRLLMITGALGIDDYLINDIINEYINRYSEAQHEDENEFERALRILGLSKNAQFEEAKAKYRILMKKYHPDKVGLLHLSPEQEARTREEYNKKTKEINEAFDIIRTHFGQ